MWTLCSQVGAATKFPYREPQPSTHGSGPGGLRDRRGTQSFPPGNPIQTLLWSCPASGHTRLQLGPILPEFPAPTIFLLLKPTYAQALAQALPLRTQRRLTLGVTSWLCILLEDLILASPEPH